MSKVYGTTRWVALGLVALLVGCSESSRQSVRELPEGAYLDTSAVVRIGGHSQDPLYQVEGGIILGDRVFVAERSSSTIRMYDVEGDVLSRIGGPGEGPGEFIRLEWIKLARGHIYAYDLELRRLSEFSEEGELVGSTVIEPLERHTFSRAIGVFEDGSILVRGANLPQLAESGRVFRHRLTLYRYSSSGEMTDSLGSYRGTEYYIHPIEGGGQLQAQLPLGRQSDIEVLGEGYALVDNGGYHIEMFDKFGNRVGKLSPPGSPGTYEVQQSDVSRVREYRERDAPRSMNLGDAFDEMPIAESSPYFGWDGRRELEVMSVMSSGDVWVLRYGGVRALNPTWSVFSLDGVDGEPVEIVALEEVEILDASEEMALILDWDEHGVERVELRRIQW